MPVQIRGRTLLVLGLVLVAVGVVTYFNPNLLPLQVTPQVYYPSEISLESGYIVSGDLDSLKSSDGNEYIYACDYMVSGNAATSFKFPLGGYVNGKITVAGKIRFSNALSGTYLWILVNGVATGGAGYASNSPFLSTDVPNILATDLRVRVRADSQPNYAPTYVQIDELSLSYEPSGSATTTTTGTGTTHTITVVTTIVQTRLVTTTVGGITTTTVAGTTMTQTTVKTVQVGTATVTWTVSQYGVTQTRTVTYTYTVEQPAKTGKSDLSWGLAAVGLLLAGVGYDRRKRGL